MGLLSSCSALCTRAANPETDWLASYGIKQRRKLPGQVDKHAHNLALFGQGQGRGLAP